jgi:hypothetical protein
MPPLVAAFRIKHRLSLHEDACHRQTPVAEFRKARAAMREFAFPGDILCMLKTPKAEKI